MSDFDPIGDIHSMIQRVREVHAQPQVVEILVTKKQAKGYYTTEKIEDEEREERFPSFKLPRRILMHPDDWRNIEKTAKAPPSDAVRGAIGGIFGVPVRKED